MTHVSQSVDPPKCYTNSLVTSTYSDQVNVSLCACAVARNQRAPPTEICSPGTSERRKLSDSSFKLIFRNVTITKILYSLAVLEYSRRYYAFEIVNLPFYCIDSFNPFSDIIAQCPPYEQWQIKIGL